VQITTENRNKYLIYMDKQQHRTVALFIQYICQELQIQQWNFHALAYEDAPDRAVETTQALKENDKLLLQKQAQPTCAAPSAPDRPPPWSRPSPATPRAALAPPLAHPASSYGRPFAPQLSGLLHGQARPGFPNIARPNLPPWASPPPATPTSPASSPWSPASPLPTPSATRTTSSPSTTRRPSSRHPNFIAFANNTGIIEDRELMVNKVKQIAVQRGFRLVIPNGRLENKILL